MNRQNPTARQRLVAVLTVLIPLLTCLLAVLQFRSGWKIKPTARTDAQSVSGALASYEAHGRYGILTLQDGSTYRLHRHVTANLQTRMSALKPGTVLHLLVHPTAGCVEEIRTDAETLLPFADVQKQHLSLFLLSIVYAVALLVIGALLTLLCCAWRAFRRKEADQLERSRCFCGADGNSQPLRPADETAKARILLQAEQNGYDICYRRVGKTNELVINGTVYDEITALIEFSHTLRAMLDGHTVEAAFDSRHAQSVLFFDREPIARKRRWI